jgi:hypothetical protein
MRRGSVTLGDLAARIAMLEVACSRCERRGRLQVDLLVAQYGDAELPELRLILAGDCPRAAGIRTGPDVAAALLTAERTMTRAGQHSGLDGRAATRERPLRGKGKHQECRDA